MEQVKNTSRIIRTKEVKTTDADYTYTLFVNESDKVASYRLPLYSIHIRMIDNEGNETSSTVREIFSDFNKANRFFNRMIDNLATPIDLPYIVEDEI